MAMNIKNTHVERLAADLARRTGESKTEAVRRALEERATRLDAGGPAGRKARWLRFLESEVWPRVPRRERGRRWTRRQEEAVLGYGREGV